MDSAAISEVADTASRLSLVVRYGGLRRFDPAPVVPLIQQLYLRACLTLAGACVCDAKAAPDVTRAMDLLNALQLSHDFLEEARWLSLLADISDRDDLNTRCSGFAMAILLERDDYLSGLDEDAFRRALVFLRRAFADFSPGEKNDIAENLGEIWGVDPRQAAEVLRNDITEVEQAVLDSLDEFDFDDI